MSHLSLDPPPPSLADFATPITLVGAGKMGSAMLNGWLSLGLDPAIVTVLEPQPSADLLQLETKGLRLNPAAGPAGVLILAVKPQVASEVMATLAPQAGRATLVVSIMAGRRLDFLAAAFPPGTAIVRAMPNTPAAVGRGITVAIGNAAVTAQQRRDAQRLIEAIGVVEWIADEALMDAVTAVSGSGPAYVFLLAEAMAEAGIAAGLPAGLAARLARATVSGSGELLRLSDLDAATLRRNVTSPGGTTAAALDVLMSHDGLTALMVRAVAAATRRSRELAG